MSAIPVGSDLNVTGRKLIGFEDPVQAWVTHTYHVANGNGQMTMPIWVPFDATITKLRYRIAVAGSGGTLTMSLRAGAGTGQTLITGTSLTPGTAPSWTTLTTNVSADDLLWPFFDSVNSTTAGQGAKVEMILRRR